MRSKPASAYIDRSKSLKWACQPRCCRRSITSRRLPTTSMAGLAGTSSWMFSSTSQSVLPAVVRSLALSSMVSRSMSDTGNFVFGQFSVFARFQHLVKHDVADPLAMQSLDPVADRREHALDLMVTALVQADTGFMFGQDVQLGRFGTLFLAVEHQTLGKPAYCICRDGVGGGHMIDLAG